MKKRLLSFILASTIVLGALTGCGDSSSGSGAATGTSSEKVTIDILQTKSEIATELQSAVDLYMQENPNIKINLETVQGNDYNTTLKAKMLGSDPVEIFAVNYTNMAVDYTDYLEDLSDQEWVKHLPEDILPNVTVDNKVLGLPISIEGYGLVYNKEIFKAAGIDASTLTTYDAIDKAFEKLQKQIDDGELKEQFPYLEAVTDYAAKETWIPGLQTLNLLFASSFSSPEEVNAADSVTFKNTEGFEQVINLLTKYTPAAKQGNLGLLNSVDYSAQIGGGLGIERIAVAQQGNWIGPELVNISEDLSQKMGMLPLPMPGLAEDSIYVGVSVNWGVNSKSSDAEKQAAKDFLNWLFQSDEGKKIVVNDLGFLPAFDNYDDLEITEPLSKAVTEYVKAGKTIPWMYSAFPSGYEAQAAADMQAYLGGEVAYEQYIENLQKDFSALK